MQTCPSCGELLGDNVDFCFKCKYNFLEERIQYEAKMSEIEQRRNEVIRRNPLYKYTTIVVSDCVNGRINQAAINDVLLRCSQDGWRLHTVLSTEIGKDSVGVSFGGIGSGTNATRDEIMLIFERIISSGDL